MLFCTDLDGTLFRSDKTVSDRNFEAIEYFKAESGIFTFITGRVPKTAGGICRLINPNGPYGCINGGGIYDPRQEEYLWTEGLPANALELVKAVDRELPEIGIQPNTRGGVYFYKDNSAMERFRRVTGLPNISCRWEEIEGSLLKVVFAHEEEGQILALADLLNRHPLAPQFDFIRSERYLYEILPKGVSKGKVLRKMAQLLGISMRKTIAVGDYYNDVSMLKAAGLSFAVDNAVPEAKAAAGYITVSNNEDAIAVIVEGIDRGEFLPRTVPEDTE